MAIDYNNYGVAVRAARCEAGRTQADLARAIGVSVANVCQVERSTRGPFPPELTRKVTAYLAPHLDEDLLLACAMKDRRRAARASEAEAGLHHDSTRYGSAG